MERTKRRYFDPGTKEIKYKYIDNVIVTYEGNDLPTKMKLYNGLVTIRARPFIEAVKHLIVSNSDMLKAHVEQRRSALFAAKIFTEIVRII